MDILSLVKIKLQNHKIHITSKTKKKYDPNRRFVPFVTRPFQSTVISYSTNISKTNYFSVGTSKTQAFRKNIYLKTSSWVVRLSIHVPCIYGYVNSQSNVTLWYRSKIVKFIHTNFKATLFSFATSDFSPNIHFWLWQDLLFPKNICWKFSPGFHDHHIGPMDYILSGYNFSIKLYGILLKNDQNANLGGPHI